MLKNYSRLALQTAGARVSMRPSVHTVVLRTLNSSIPFTSECRRIHTPCYFKRRPFPRKLAPVQVLLKWPVLSYVWLAGALDCRGSLRLTQLSSASHKGLQQDS